MKNVLVTGASKGIGKVIAVTLKTDYNVFVTARNEADLKLINPLGYCVCDLKIHDDLDKLSKFIVDNKIDILINNAGDYSYNCVDEFSYDEMQSIFSINLLAPTFLIAAAVKNMKKNSWGRIVNIGSISGVVGEAFACTYSASKSGLIGLTKSLALELAQHNVTVNTINPGWVDTELAENSINISEFDKQEIIECIPQKRFIEPIEVANLVRFLISEQAKGLTGQSISLCAGLSVG